MIFDLVYFDINTGYYPGFHHGLAYLAGQIRTTDVKLRFHHLTKPDELNELSKKLSSEPVDYLGLSFTTNQKRYAKDFCSKTTKSGFWLAGGVHVTLQAAKVFDEIPELDAICIGEGDKPILDFLKAAASKMDVSKIPSISVKSSNKVTSSCVAPLVELDDLAFPDYSVFNFEKIIRDNAGLFPMLLGRGCPYACSYCCNHAIKNVYPNKQRYVRFPSVTRSIALIKNNLALCPETKIIAFADDTFTLNKAWLFEFCAKYKQEIGLPFLCNARVETIDETVAQNLKQAGCFSLDFGVETGNEWLRKTVLNRRHSNETIKKAFAIAQKHGLRCFSFNITALPFETFKMAQETIALNLSLRPHLGKCFYFFPYPGSSLNKICADFELLSDQNDTVSGYLEKPIIKPIFMSHKEAKVISDTMNIYFYVRLACSKYALPVFLERGIFYFAKIFRGPILGILQAKDSSSFYFKLRMKFRKIAIRHFR